jgi:lysophospholipase L1-like esterase
MPTFLPDGLRLRRVPFLEGKFADSKLMTFPRILSIPLGALVVAQAFLGIIPSADAASAPVRIVIVGDSTVAQYPAKDFKRGWGQFLAEDFRPGAVEVIDLAAPGRSTKSFIREGRWQKARAERPDYVLIQFGHNDSHAPSRPEATDPATDYRANLRRYIDESQEIGAAPILVTPMVRRTFDAQGRIVEGQPVPNRPLAAYAEAMKAVGAEKNVPVIDLYASSKALVEKLGPSASMELASEKSDVTHFNEKGARAMAALVIQGLPAAAPGLAGLLK